MPPNERLGNLCAFTSWADGQKATMLSENDQQTLFRSLQLNRVTLFAGAGFSRGARNGDARQIALADELARRLWNYLYETPYDGKTNLRTLYEAARTHKKGGG